MFDRETILAAIEEGFAAHPEWVAVACRWFQRLKSQPKFECCGLSAAYMHLTGVRAENIWNVHDFVEEVQEWYEEQGLRVWWHAFQDGFDNGTGRCDYTDPVNIAAFQQGRQDGLEMRHRLGLNKETQ